MKKENDIQPPRWAQRLLKGYCRAELLEDLEGDLHEYFQRNLKSKGKRRARLTYVLDVLKFFRYYTIRKPQPVPSMNNLIVLQNYFKTSIRNISRNKLFSSINIVGLAISMSVGLLLIAFLAELKSYDTFHANYDLIYRVKNIHTSRWGANTYASTSVLAGKKIQESVAGIEDVVIIRANFDKDIHIGEKTVPLRGILANEAFFNVFSWQVIGGNASTALTDLNSLVLTETSAIKLFGTTDVVGKQVLVDTANYSIGAVMKDPPKNSHLRFEMIASFATLDSKKLADQDQNWMKWDNMWQNYVYILLPENHDTETIEKSFAGISAEQNKTLENQSISIHLQPFHEMVLSPDMSNQIGPNFDRFLVWVLGGLAFIVIVSACFNYTNLSIARALRRAREVGIRKVVGASRRQVFNQFVFEAVIISLLALILSFLMFLLMRPGFLSMDRIFQELVTLQPTPSMYFYFVGLAIGAGVMAGFLPALFFSRVNTSQVLKDLSSVKLFRHINFRKTLIIFQYTLSLLLIVSVSLGFRQYKYSLAFDLGLSTENILNVDLQGNKPDLVMKELSELSEVSLMAKSLYVTSVGTSWSGNIRYNDPQDSATLYYNYVDSAYLSLHKLELLAGRNFQPPVSGDINEAGIIVNRKTMAWMGLSDARDAVGEEVSIDGEKIKIIGVVPDFHHNTLNNPIDNFAFRYYGNLSPRWGGVVNLGVQSRDLPAFMSKLEVAWKKIDPVHPLKAEFYEEKIRNAYDELSGMIKIIGFLAFLAISIASLGLLGMVVFTTETRLKEISIRKVLGATEGNLVILMSRGFLLLLAVACLISIPGAYYLFDRVLFANHSFRAPIGFLDLFSGALIVLSIAVLAISSQTLRVARINPATTLRNE